MNHEPRDPDYEARVRESFARQTVMATLGASLTSVEPGRVSITLPYNAALAQQHGYLHAGVVSTILDSACGYAALSTAEPGTAVLAVEFKVNFMAPAKGDRIVAHAHVKKSGRTLAICAGDAVAYDNGTEKTVATMLSTIMLASGRGLAD